MSLRPRYSLLTLLVLTALVAGGAWYWFKPTRYEFDLTQEWDHFADHDPLEDALHRAAAFAERRPKGSVVYETRRTLAGSREFLAAKYRWENSPTLVRFTRPQTQHDDYLLTSPNPQVAQPEIQYNAEHYGLKIVSTEKAICWVAAQVEHLNYVQVERPDCATGLCQLPVAPDPEARTSYLLTDSGKIYQLNLRGGQCDLTAVTLDQVADSCRAMLAEELRNLQQ